MNSRRPRLLIVDDAEGTVELLTDLLDQQNYEVVSASSGTNALALLEQDSDFDVILLDIIMPGMNGFEVLEILKANPQTASIKVIMLSALTDAGGKIKTLSSGAADYVGKPFQPGELIVRVQTQIRLKQVEEALQAAKNELETKVEMRTADLQAANEKLREEIAERTRAEAQRDAMLKSLRLSEEKFSKAFRASPDSISISVLADGRYIEINDNFEKITGYCHAEVIGNTPDDLKLWNDPDEYETFIQAVQEKGGIHDLETTFRKKSGEKGVMLVSSELAEIDDEQCLLTIMRDITQRKQDEEEIKASLREKEVLLKEIHHRVKNNLQIISSLLNLQSSHSVGVFMNEELQDSQNRIRSMALIHERLYRSEDLAQINFADYVQDLTHNLRQSYTAKTDKIQLTVDTEVVYLDIDTAIPCGLLLNELVSNAIQHAFPNDMNGKIEVKLRKKDDDQLLLQVSDNGVGFPEGMAFGNTETLGLQLVQSLIQQLNGTIELQQEGGTQVKLQFSWPKDDEES